MPDPAEYVDEFSDRVKRIQQIITWDSRFQERYLLHDAYRTREWFRTLFEELDESLKTQDRINVMMLAAIDELKGRDIPNSSTDA